MRATTAGELTILAATTRLITQRVKVKNGSGTFIDLSSWVESVRIEQDIDQPIAGCTVEFRRDSGTTLSLAPLRTDSTLNRLDNGVDYSPQLDLNRVITVEEATTPIGTAPVAADYKLLFHGTIDTVNFERSPVVCSCRDLGAPLVDRWIEAVAIYGSDVGVALETVMQQILDAIFGGGFVPLYTPVSPSYVVAPAYIQQKQSMMDAQYALAQLPGWDVRYRWDDGTSTFRFTLAQPPRTKTVPDYTFGPSAYFDVTRLELDLTNVKNVITVSYYDTASNARLEVTVSDTTSITKYGRRYFFIQEPDGSPISANAEATTMANAALSDLKEPKAEFEVDAPFFWPGDLWDLYRFPTNTVHFNSNQDWAVVSITHSLSRNKHRTILRVRGQPAGGYTSWIYREQGVPTPRPGEVGPEPRIEIFGPSPRHLVTVRYTATGGTAPLTYERRIDVDGISTGTYSAPAALGAGVTENIPTHQYRATRIYLRVTDATGLEGNHDPFFLKGWDASSDGAGHGVGQDEEERVRGGGGGYGIPRGRYHTEPIHDATGFDPLLDTELGQVGSALKANDGQAGIESQRAATRKGAFGAGAGAKGITEEEETRTGVGGVPVPLQRFHGIPLYDVTGSVPLIDTLTRRIQSGALGPTGIGMDTVEMGGDRGSRALNSSDKLVTGITSAAKYADGATGIDSLKPEEAGANVTETRTAADVQVGVGKAVLETGANKTETRTSADTAAVDGTSAATVKGGAVRANTGLDGTGKLVTGITAAAKYADGVTAIDALKPAEASANRVFGLVSNKITPDSTNGRNRCRATPTANQTIATGTDEVLDFGAETYDTGALHDNSTNNTRITIPTGGNIGVWLFTASVAWTANGTGLRLIYVKKNGTTILGTNVIPAVAGGGAGGSPVHSVMVFDDAPSVGDYYEAFVAQTSGGNLDTLSNGYTFFAATHLW